MHTLIEQLRIAMLPVLSEGSWNSIEQDHQRVQLRWRPEFEPGWGKPKYVERVLSELSADELESLARRCLESFPERCIAVQDALWWIEAEGTAEISELTRMALAEAFDGHRLHPYAPPDEVLRKFAKPVDGTVFCVTAFHYKDGSDNTLYAQRQNPLAQLFESERQPPLSEQTSHRELLTAYGFLSWPDVRLFKFLEYLVHPTVRQGEEQDEWVAFINQAISVDGFHLIETASLSGHPVFSVHHKSPGVRGKPKNLIFASTGPKPELGFNDAINNDIIILRNAEHCLIYTEHIGTAGLRWEDLVAWWANLHDQDPTADETRQALGRRLMEALGSPPEKYFFKAYFQQFARELGQNLPALVPQVYLHYDPVSLRELQARGEGKRFLNQRMDFLMLLPENVRVVLEIDGQQHYTCTASSGDSARPSPKMYAETVRSDRQLRLTGYESYRFGGYEVRNPTAAENTVREFFYELFRHHRVLP